MGISFSKEKEAGESGKRKIIITASPAACSGLAVVSLLCFVWVFVFGLIVGRGYQPEEALPKLKQIMPAPRPEAAASSAPAIATSEEAKPSQQVIKPEDLAFYDQLKKDPAPAARPSKPAPAKPVASAAQAKPTATPAKAGTQVTLPKPEAKPGNTTFAYVYQAAASKDRDAAEHLKSRIESSGLQSRIESVTTNGATWHRVLVLFRGTPEETSTMKDTLQNLGVTKPLLKEKTPL
ncbi:SPOR domain-containing protein [Desulfovibrio mangrovi]|uniref:SPOR domain-containing protein n=1 Tax=Desulfovibrio mangrovi TaxID=2976983 RepID=UPI0022455110|nr:SPOR domain-containing protein [Desulfovibrio mangrovi]UZP67802.1 SPOR domain-containing protein [Desulfovibrio mangrovi]